MSFWRLNFLIYSGVVGIEKSIRMLHEHEYMGFLSFCDEWLPNAKRLKAAEMGGANTLLTRPLDVSNKIKCIWGLLGPS